MVADIERTGSVTLHEVIAALPEAMSTIIVSPMARPKPSTHAAKIPGVAAGKTTLHAVSQGVAPRANEASRYERGTAASASSDTVKITGMIVSASPRPAT